MTSSNEATAEWHRLCAAESALASALTGWQGEHLSPHTQKPTDLTFYGLSLSFSVDERGWFQAHLLHVDGARLDSGWAPTPDAARDLVLGVQWMS